MPALDDAQHEKFVQELVKGKGQGEAYLAAGYKAKSVSVASACATRLLKNAKIQNRLREMQATAEVETMLTLEEHMRELKLLRELAKQNGQTNAAITAEVKRGELRKFYVKQIEHGGAGEFDDVADDELSASIAAQTRELAEMDPEFAAQLKSKRATKH